MRHCVYWTVGGAAATLVMLAVPLLAVRILAGAGGAAAWTMAGWSFRQVSDAPLGTWDLHWSWLLTVVVVLNLGVALLLTDQAIAGAGIFAALAGWFAVLDGMVIERKGIFR